MNVAQLPPMPAATSAAPDRSGTQSLSRGIKLMYELGLALPDRVQFVSRAEAIVQAFARRLGGVALLLLRSGNEYVCAVRAGKLQAVKS